MRGFIVVRLKICNSVMERSLQNKRKTIAEIVCDQVFIGKSLLSII